MKNLILAFVLIVTFQFAIAEEISDSKKLLIDKLLVQMGQSAIDSGKLFSDLFINNIITVLKQTKPDINPKAFDIVEQEVKLIINENFVHSSVLSEMMYPIYGSKFSESELKELIAFYNTPLGRKLIRVLPALTREGMQAGKKLGQSLGPKIEKRIIARLKSEGIKI